MFEIQVLAWDWHKIMAGLNWIMRPQPSLLNNRISTKQFIYEETMKNDTNLFPLKNTTYCNRNE